MMGQWAGAAGCGGMSSVVPVPSERVPLGKALASAASSTKGVTSVTPSKDGPQTRGLGFLGRVRMQNLRPLLRVRASGVAPGIPLAGGLFAH